MAGGRPSSFTQEMADRICGLISKNAIGIKRLCAMHDDLPDVSTIFDWKNQFPEFSYQYTRAKSDQMELFVDELVDIADDKSQDKMINDQGKEVGNGEFIARSRVRIDTRKWLASKLAPKIYGDQKTLDELTAKNVELHQELLELKKIRDDLDKKNKKDY